MPSRRKSSIGRQSLGTRATRRSRNNQSNDQRAIQNELNRLQTLTSRVMQSQQERDASNHNDRLRMQRNRSIADRSGDNRAQENLAYRIRRQTAAPQNLLRVAFAYDPSIDYNANPSVAISTMDVVCCYCKAIKFPNEPPGLCCANGKVKLPPLNPPPEPLSLLISGFGSDSKHFLKNIQSYNGCFQMTSFGASRIIRNNFMPTFKVISIFYGFN